MADNVNVILDAKPLARLASQGQKLKPFLESIGAYPVGLSHKSFAQQEWQGARWIARSVPNIPGIVRDLERAPSIQPKRFESRPALVDTGDLSKSIHSRVIGSRAVEVFSTSPYASLHQDGGDWSMSISETAKKNLKIILGKSENMAA